MASSSHYYNLYVQMKNEIRSYDGDLKDLQKILGNLSDTMYDEIRAINNELDDLKSDLGKSIRHNARFTSRANSVTAEKEKTVTADSNLSIVIQELQEEISRVNALRNQSIANRDYYYQMYIAKKEEERQAFLNSLLKKEGKT